MCLFKYHVKIKGANKVQIIGNGLFSFIYRKIVVLGFEQLYHIICTIFF